MLAGCEEAARQSEQGASVSVKDVTPRSVFALIERSVEVLSMAAGRWGARVGAGLEGRRQVGMQQLQQVLSSLTGTQVQIGCWTLYWYKRTNTDAAAVGAACFEGHCGRRRVGAAVV